MVFYWERDELNRIAEAMGKKLRFEEFLSIFDGSEKFVYIYRWLIEDACPFLEANRCMIHENKPLSCKIFPLIIRIPDLAVIVSSRCRWVRMNSERIKPENIPTIFDEFFLAVKVLAMVDRFLSVARMNGWTINVGDRSNKESGEVDG